MQNKRGISQAFLAPLKGTETDITIRVATVFDVFDMSKVLTDSITTLCAADHQNGRKELGPWIAKKTPEHIRSWIISGQNPLVGEVSDRVAAVGLTTPDGEVSLLYVASTAMGQGLGHAMLAALEAQLELQGQHEGRLTATQTALKFYLSHGWEAVGPLTNCFGLLGQPMRKLLQPAG